jgi:hypothetical protein
MQDIFSYIRGQRTEYEQFPIPLTDGDNYSQYDTLRQINYYWRNKYLDAAEDDIIGPYPFDNISKFRVLLEARATDFDTKHVEIEPDKPDRLSRVKAMIASKALHKKMRKIKFGAFINDLCITRPKYGGVLVKKTDEGVFVSKWENLITDQSDIMAGIRIERHYMTPSEMLKKKSNWRNVIDAIQTAAEWRDKDVANAGEGDVAQTQGDLIEVYELQGDFTKSELKLAQAMMMGDDLETIDYEEDDDYEYQEVKIVCVGADWVEEVERTSEDGTMTKEEECKGIILYAEAEKSTHKYLARNPMAGRGLGEGIPESTFEHQKWHNFTKTEEMRMIAIAGKKLYWSDDPDILTNIFDEGVDHGTVLRVSEGKQIHELSQVPTGTPIYQGIRQEWDQSADRATSSFNSKLGEEAKSGTPFRSQYLQNLEATSQFEQYREEIGFLLQEIAEDWLLPEALEELATEAEIYASFTPQELMLIDEVLVTEEVNKKFIEKTLKEEVVTPEMLQVMQAEAEAGLMKQGTKRHIEDLQDFIKGAAGSVIVHTTDEARNKAVYFESLSNILALLNPEDPRRNAIIDRILDSIGISKEELELYMTNDVMPGNANPQLESKEMASANKAPAEAALNLTP